MPSTKRSLDAKTVKTKLQKVKDGLPFDKVPTSPRPKTMKQQQQQWLLAGLRHLRAPLASCLITSQLGVCAKTTSVLVMFTFCTTSRWGISRWGQSFPNGLALTKRVSAIFKTCGLNCVEMGYGVETYFCNPCIEWQLCCFSSPPN